MDDKTQKEKLEQELRFLKESFEAEVISKDEFEKGKKRIEKKLNEIMQSAEKEETGAQKEEVKEKNEHEQKTEPLEKKEEPDEAKSEAKTEERIKLKVIDEGQYFEPQEAENKEPVENKTKPQEKKESNKIFKYGVVFIVMLLIGFFSYSLINQNKNTELKTEQKELIPKTELQKTNLLVLNDRKSCFNCDTQRILAILENWLGELNAGEISYNTEEGKRIAEKLDAKLLPLYIFDENITKSQNFEQIKGLFIKKGANYVLSDDAAGSTLYFARENVPNKLDLFVKPEDGASIRSEKNLKGFLDAFKEVKFDKHISSDKLTQELKIKTFPTFLINNKVKFSGVHTAQNIKENFCKLNKLPACEKSLSSSLI